MLLWQTPFRHDPGVLLPCAGSPDPGSQLQSFSLEKPPVKLKGPELLFRIGIGQAAPFRLSNTKPDKR